MKLMNRVVKNVVEKFNDEFSHKAALIVRSPGRVNIIGEHVDYNEGFVLPAAIILGLSYFYITVCTNKKVKIFSRSIFQPLQQYQCYALFLHLTIQNHLLNLVVREPIISLYIFARL